MFFLTFISRVSHVCQRDYTVQLPVLHSMTILKYSFIRSQHIAVLQFFPLLCCGLLLWFHVPSYSYTSGMDILIQICSSQHSMHKQQEKCHNSNKLRLHVSADTVYYFQALNLQYKCKHQKHYINGMTFSILVL